MTITKTCLITFLDGASKEVDFTGMAGCPHPDFVCFMLPGKKEFHLNLTGVLSMDFSPLEKATPDLILPH